MAGCQGELSRAKAVCPGRNENVRGQYGGYVPVCGFPSSCLCPPPEIPPSGEGQEMAGVLGKALKSLDRRRAPPLPRTHESSINTSIMFQFLNK